MLTREDNISPLLTARPELMVAQLTRDTLQQGLDWADVVVMVRASGRKVGGEMRCAL